MGAAGHLGQPNGSRQSDQLESEAEQGLEANGGDGHAEEDLATSAAAVSVGAVCAA